VPRLATARHNEARRFTILIDTLYDRGTRLVISAATPPDDIYDGAGTSVEFARTVSRLHEMCSQAYWQAHGAAAGGHEFASGEARSRLAATTHPG
jgi:cell division protein ZapE